MSSVAVGNKREQAERVLYEKLLVAGLVALLGSVLANLLLRVIAVALLRPDPAFMQLQWGPPIFFSVIGVLGAIGAYALIGRRSQRPISLFRRVALIVLLLSFIPDVLLLFAGAAVPGVTLPNVIALMLMHVVAWYITVQALTRLAGEQA
jgi:cytosine/uracil/thiamine/allantoin permease